MKQDGQPATEPPILVVNAGSSSLKVKLLPQGLSLLVERIGGETAVRANFSEGLGGEGVRDHEDALELCLAALRQELPLESLFAVGHRVAHGGERYTEPTLLTAEVIEEIEALAVLAPLHNPANLKGIRAARRLLPAVPQVAVFDTAFHSTLPPRAYLYGLPYRFYSEEGIRRYGFHGSSHDYVTRRAAELLDRPRETLRLISLHLGNGASAAAVAHGESIDTSMGFTPLEGLLMGTRSGDLDPGVLLHLLRLGFSADELDTLLNKRSGLLGVSGVSNDMRDLHHAAETGNVQASLALELFAYRIRKTVGAYAAAMGGLDALVFTGGIGENDAKTRAASANGLAFLGLELDEGKNLSGETEIQADGSRVKVLVVPTDEEGTIARAVLETLRQNAGRVV